MARSVALRAILRQMGMSPVDAEWVNKMLCGYFAPVGGGDVVAQQLLRWRCSLPSRKSDAGMDQTEEADQSFDADALWELAAWTEFERWKTEMQGLPERYRQ